MTYCLVAFGSNLGDRQRIYRESFENFKMSFGPSDYKASSVYETEPVDLPPGTWKFLNAVWGFETGLLPREILMKLQELEDKAGRTRSGNMDSRMLDLDLLFYGDAIIDEPDLWLPHPRLHNRAFVLGPCREIAGSFRDPKTGLTIDELWGQLPATEKAKIKKLDVFEKRS